jgi:hypothetical protein
LKLDLSLLGSEELKQLSTAVDTERKRRSRKNPANHEPPLWTVPNKALKGEKAVAPPG